MSYFRHHLFFCCNQRDNGRDCHSHGASEMFAWTKERVAELELNGPGKVRVSKAGCLGRCEIGPALVVYPDAIWYSYANRDDIEEIIQQHLIGGRVVERLRR